MKPIPSALLALAVLHTALHSQDEGVLEPTIARIIGVLPDGTPPPPAPPKPGFTIPSRDILETKVHQKDGRSITIQRIAPIALPPPPVAALSEAIDPAFQERTEEISSKRPADELMILSATVFRAADSPPRSLVRYWAGGESVTLWSSADFALLSGFSSFTGSDGHARSVIMAWSHVDIDRMTDLMEKHRHEYDAPEIPQFPEGKASYLISSAKPSAEALIAIQSLHELYNNELVRLQTAYEGRERARLLREADLLANPPRPKDIILNHWRIGSATLAGPAKGGDK